MIKLNLRNGQICVLRFKNFLYNYSKVISSYSEIVIVMITSHFYGIITPFEDIIPKVISNCDLLCLVVYLFVFVFLIVIFPLTSFYCYMIQIFMRFILRALN